VRHARQCGFRQAVANDRALGRIEKLAPPHVGVFLAFPSGPCGLNVLLRHPIIIRYPPDPAAAFGTVVSQIANTVSPGKFI